MRYTEQMELPQKDASPKVELALARLREATLHTEFEKNLYIVGGMLRDRALGLPLSGDIDLVLIGDAIQLARLAYDRGLSTHFPVLYPRFGTAMVTIDTHAGQVNVELVTARAESYQPDSRKPTVAPGTLEADVQRRDFTINTLLQNLHTGQELDITGRARDDLKARVLRTPVDPNATFFDDPLRMLRAVRFAARFQFDIDPGVWAAIHAESARLRPPAISSERIRDEFVKIALLPGSLYRRGMELLLESNLLAEFLPEMLPMVGCTQGAWHSFDVWGHTLKALEALPDEASEALRLGLLWHDIAKPATRTESNDAKGVRFTGHAVEGANIVRSLMSRLKFSNDEIQDVCSLVRLHMRLGEYREDWSDSAVKRMIRDCGGQLDELFILTKCDQSAIDLPWENRGLLLPLRERVDRLNEASNVLHIGSPLDGRQIMEVLGLGQGPYLKEAKEYLTNEVLDGNLAEGDTEGAQKALIDWWKRRGSRN